MFVSITTFTLLSLLAAAVFWLFSKTLSNPDKSLVDAIPGPPAIAILGNAHQLKTGGPEFFQQLLELCQEFGAKTGLFRVWLGSFLVAVITRAETAEVVLKSSKLITKAYQYNFLMPWLGTGLLTSTNEKWHSRRKLLTPSFHFRILEDFLQVFNEQTTVLQNRLGALVDQNKAVSFDISPYITLCALDIICDTAMGKHVGAQDNSDSDYVRAIYKISEVLMKRMKSPWLWFDALYNLTPDGRAHNKMLKTLHDFTNKVICERQEEFNRQRENQVETTDINTEEIPAAIGQRKRLAFLDMLLHSAQSAQLGQEDIREEVDTFMFEGHDTTSVAANWAIHLIGSDEEVQRKLHDELDRIFGDSDRDVTMNDIKELKYLECTVKEALRLFPSVPFFGREVTEDTNIGGYHIPKGATALIITSFIHRDPAYFPDPERFDPDRWLTVSNRHPFAYIPFSAGLRNCIGQKFAMNEEKVILSSILRRFKVTSLQSRDQLIQNGEIILRSQNGILVRLERR